MGGVSVIESNTKYKLIKLRYLLDRRGYKSGPFGSTLILDQLNMEGELMIYSPEHITNMEADTFYLPKERYKAMNQFFLEVNDIFFPIVGTLGKAKIFDSSMPKGMMNQRLARISPDTRKVMPLYLWRCMCEFDSFKEQLASSSRGAILEHITKEALVRIAIPFPKIDEQASVLAYLDRRTAEIDRLLTDLQSQAEMLEQYKRELIADTIIHGLDKSVPLRDSGVDWIGSVPEHWECHRIKNLFKLRKELNYLPLEEVEIISLYTDLGVLKNRDIEKTTGNKAHNADGYKHVYKNDIVVNIILCWMGAIGMSNYDGVTSPAYDVYKPNENLVSSRYYHYLFRTPKFNDECYKRGRGIMLMRWRTYSDDFVDIRVPLPPLEEQEKIAAFLDVKTVQIEGLTTDIKEQIGKLKQYRQIVIHDAVTGKIKVTEG